MRTARRNRPNTRRSSAAVSVAVPLQNSGLSAKTLDLVSLAVCSCALTLLCHSAANLPTAASAQPAGNSGATASVFQPFTLTSPRPAFKEDAE